MKKNVGRWEIQVGPRRVIRRDLIEELERFLSQEWKQAMLEEVSQPWWSVKHLGAPSPIVRVDMAPVTELGAVKDFIYEVEVRPAGIGLILSLASERVEQWKKVLCQCQGLISIQSSIQDDKLMAEILEIPFFFEEIPKKLGGPYWIRSDARTGEITTLESVSLVPIQSDGDKTYLAKLGMAEMLKKERLDWSLPFAVKPLVGSRMERVEIYAPKFLRAKGGSTKSRILRTISGEAPYIIQKFISPQREEMNSRNGWTIWRLFFGWKRRYEFLGGLWNWRPTLRVHGASDAIFGVIEMEV